MEAQFLDIQIPCACGAKIPVAETAAGTVVECACGKKVEVPSLAELRKLAGLPVQVSPTLVIQDMVANGELPTLACCVLCQTPTQEQAAISVKYASAWTPGPGGIARLIGFLAFGMWYLVLQFFKQGQEYGENRILHLPVRICANCRAKVLRTPISAGLVAAAIAVGAVGVILVDLGKTLGWPLFVISLFLLLYCAVRSESKKAAVRKLVRSELPYRALLKDYPDAILTPNRDWHP